MESFGDGIASAVTSMSRTSIRCWRGSTCRRSCAISNERRWTLRALGGVERYRVSNVVLPEEFDAIQAGLQAGHQAAKSAIKAHRADLPVGFSIAMIDDQVIGDNASVRDRKRTEVCDQWLASRPATTSSGAELRTSLVRRRSGRSIHSRRAEERHGIGDRSGLAGRSGPLCILRSAVPIMVTEHGMSTHDDALRSVHPAGRRWAARAMTDGVPVLGYMHWSLLDNFEWIFGFDGRLGLFAVDRTTFERTPKASGGVQPHRPGQCSGDLSRWRRTTRLDQPGRTTPCASR